MNVIARFFSYYKSYRFLFWADMACATVVSGIDLLFPQALRWVTGQVASGEAKIAGPDFARAGAILALGLFGLYIARFFAQYFITAWGHIMGARMERDMRRDLFYHMQKLSFSYYDRNNTGEMLSRVVSDLFDISEMAHHGPENVFISILKIGGAFVFLTMLDAKMTLILLAVTVCMVAFTGWQNLRMRRIFRDNRQKIAAINARVQDSLGGIRVVQSFANEPVEQEKFDESNREFLESKTSSYRLMGRFYAGNSFLEGILYVLVILVGVSRVAAGSLAAADLAVYALYIAIYLGPLHALLDSTELFQRGFSGFARFAEILETEPDIADAPGARELGTANPAERGDGRNATRGAVLGALRGALRFENVRFGYETSPGVLNGIDLEIPAGTKCALVGPSGGGKTTICSLIPRFYDPTSGRVTIDGMDTREATLASLRANIGIVQQDVYLFGGTIRENIAYGRGDATEEEIVEAAKNANIHDFIAGLPDGYDSLVGERGVRLSGGQKQRVSIARVFLKNPPILILDEATSALDTESERFIQSSLDRLSERRTTLVIAHRLSTVRNADEIVVIDGGKVRERGSHEDLLAEGGLYARLTRLDLE